MKRVLTALVLLPVVIGLLLWAPNRSVRLALTFVALLCLSEFLRLAVHYNVAPMRLVAYLAGAWIVATELPVGAPFFLGVALLLLTLAMRGDRELEVSLTSVAATLLGVVYTTVPFRLAADLHTHPNGPRWLLFLLLVNWAGDTAAYYVGRSFGRHQLAPLVSPNKTWEGAAASTLVAAVLGTLFVRQFLPSGPVWWFAPVLSTAANLAGQVGDLAESALKRGAGVKDSGSVLPGHGGMLDRLDGILFSVPVVCFAVLR